MDRSAVLILISFVVLMTTPLVVAVQPRCNPFPFSIPTIQSTCSGAIDFGANGTVLTFTSLLGNCESADASNSVSLYFDYLYGTTLYGASPEQWNLTYSIMWNDTATNCVLDVTTNRTSEVPIMSYQLPSDTEGFDNDPMTDISSRALNKWYTRTFMLRGSSLSSFRFGLKCAAASGGSGQTHQAYIKDITIASSLGTQTLSFSFCQTYTECPRKSIDGAECYLLAGRYKWVYYGDIWVPNLIADGPLIVIGNVRTDLLTVHETLEVQGCISTYSKSTLSVTAFSNSRAYIFQGTDCSWPQYEVIPNARVAIYMSGYDEVLCPETGTVYIQADAFSAEVNENSMLISTTSKGYTCSAEYAYVAYLIIVPSVVGIAGVIIAIVFGVRRYRQNQKAKQLDKEMEQNNSTM